MSAPSYRPRRSHPLLGATLLVAIGACVLVGLFALMGTISLHTPDPVSLPICVIVIALLGWGLIRAGRP